MRKHYSIIPDGSMDYAVRNNKTGEIEAIIAKAGLGARIGYIRFMKDHSGEWKMAVYASFFRTLKDVRAYYDQVRF